MNTYIIYTYISIIIHIYSWVPSLCTKEVGLEPRGSHGSLDQGRAHRHVPHVPWTAWRHQTGGQGRSEGATQLCDLAEFRRRFFVKG